MEYTLMESLRLLPSATCSWVVYRPCQKVWENPILCQHILSFLSFHQLLEVRKINKLWCDIAESLVIIRLHRRMRPFEISTSHALLPLKKIFQTDTPENASVQFFTKKLNAYSGEAFKNIFLRKKCDNSFIKMNLESAFLDLWFIPNTTFRFDLNFLGSTSLRYHKDFLQVRNLILKAMRVVLEQGNTPVVKNILEALENKTFKNPNWKFLQKLSTSPQMALTLCYSLKKSSLISEPFFSVLAKCVRGLPDSFLEYCVNTMTDTNRNSCYNVLGPSWKCLTNWLRCLLDMIQENFSNIAQPPNRTALYRSNDV